MGPSFQKGKGKGSKGLRSFPMDKKVWIGGLPADSCSVELNKKLCEHMKQAGQCKFAEVGKSGMGGAAYATAEEVAGDMRTLPGASVLRRTDRSVFDVCSQLRNV